jgi:hypothetical protein
MAIKYNKWPQNRTNGHKIDHLPLKEIPCEFSLNWYFWFENIPSGKPGGTAV